MGELTTKDQEQLRLLTVFHYVVSGIAGLFALFPVMHVVMGYMIVTNPAALFGKNYAGGNPPPFLGWLFMVIGGAFIIAGLTYALLLAVAGKCIARRRRRFFCLFMAGWSCMFMPFGTALGVFTFIVLLRPAVKEQFAR